MIVRELLTRLGFAVDETGAKRYEQVMGGLQAKALGVQQALGRAKQAFGGILARAGAMFGARKVMNLAETWQGLEAQLDSVSRSTGEQTKSLHELNAAAKAARVGIEAYADSYVTLMRTGMSSQDAFDIAGIVGQTGSSGAAMYQFNQAMGSGILQGDELRSIFEDTGILAEALAVGLGTDVAGMKKLGKEGKLTTKTVMDAVRKAKPWIEKNRSSVIKLSQAWTVLNNSMLETAGGSDQARWGIRALTNTVMWLADHTNVLVGAFAVFAAGSGLAFLMWVAEAAASLMALGKALALFAATPLGLAVVAGLALLVVALQDAYSWVEGNDSLLGRWLGTWDSFKPRAVAALTAARNSLDGMKDVMDSIMAGEFFRAWGQFASTDKAFTVALGFTPEDVSRVFNDALLTIFKRAGDGLSDAMHDALSEGGDALVGKLGAFFATLNPANWFRMEDTGIFPYVAKKARDARDWANRNIGLPSLPSASAFPPAPQGGSPEAWKVPKGLDLLAPSSMRLPRGRGMERSAVNNVSLQLGDINVQAPPGADAKEHGALVATEIERIFNRKMDAMLDSAMSSFPESA